ncbi:MULTISPECIES: dTDP-4-dehydrorhamnose reductase [unclassified Sinorhizobium]|uniref:dTDP-4-dehydrorhamnose reductase n=1 Tax=unclassified Sinorhizobium TaxID=2613772 RepID=UPI0024C3E326|nr:MULTISPECIES: dTDP-4-dehydrorhamnose reductase [unclassified Sinorhizobium]MDK1374731.1 dTDP-4-dehydrorhamnose reductase [Sinorhizobium sp. 6-70]MDK1479085.1 dTDP-4-dehydrorhamnose reductase [Sinorhizobium sp. 6-117]
MRIVVTGCKGQLAQSLVERAHGWPDIEIVAVGRPDLDLARMETILPAIERCRPDLVVSAAAYTAVDQAESEAEKAFAINALGAGAVAEAAAALDVPVIHLSTDYVFDGTKEGSYCEDDAAAPLSLYGASKLAGERAVITANPFHLVLRTGWVYSPVGKNFVKTMLRLAEDHEEIAVVADQWGNPSSALDLADAILSAAGLMTQRNRDQVSGIYHLSGTGIASRADLARHVLSVSGTHGGPSARVRNVPTTDFPAPARRPANSSLCCARFAETFGWTMRAWQPSVETTVRRLLRDRAG